MSNQGICQDNGSGAAADRPAPVARNQRPGLSVLSYRIGTHASFKASMKGRIHEKLGGLTFTEESDPTLALMDAGAAMLDVLTFYQERIANEGFLRTASERRSVLELSRAIGYEINPGLAASADLAVTVEEPPGWRGSVWVEAGTRIQSIPGPGQKAQLFETVGEKQEARAQWNLLRVKDTRDQEIAYGQTSLVLKGADLRLQPGDLIVVVGKERKHNVLSERWDARILSEITVSREEGSTVVKWSEGLGHIGRSGATVYPSQDEPELHVFRQRASLFGHNAPQALILQKSVNDDKVIAGNEWVGFSSQRGDATGLSPAGHPRQIDLNASYPKILKDSWLLLTRAWHPSLHPSRGSSSHPRNDFAQLYWIEGVSLGSRSDFSLSSEITRITLDKKQDLNQFGLRETAVYVQSEALELAEIPLTTPITGATVELSQSPQGMFKGQRMAAWGKDAFTDEEIAEVVTISDISGATLWLDPPLKKSYRASSLCLSGNVVKATHGETRQEVLGSGDATRRFQRFTLKQLPITYVAAATATGGRSTLEVRVDDVLWLETPSLLGHNGKDHVYTARLDDDGKVTLQFGDGRHGARLPTGIDNVTARYRVGTGLEGMVQPSQLSLLVTRPLGVKGATNPGAAAGANDRESRDEARANAPFTVFTLERIVSLRDYEIFSRCFSGIGKAKAVWLHNARGRFVHLTVLAATGDPVSEGSELFNNLNEAILGYGLPCQQFLVQSSALLYFGLQAKVQVRQGYLEDQVFATIRSVLVECYRFEKRTFGEPVQGCEVIALIQKVPGVEMVDLDFLSQGGTRASDLVPRCAYWDRRNNTIHPAQMLVIDAKGIKLVKIKGQSHDDSRRQPLSPAAVRVPHPGRPGG